MSGLRIFGRRMRIISPGLFLLAMLAACAVGSGREAHHGAPTAPLALIPSTPPLPPPLPTPHANNAVAALGAGPGRRIYSFNGLRAGKSFRDTSREAWVFEGAAGRWRRLPDLPAAGGRLASVAVALGEAIYIFGGYTVAEDGAEVSTPEVFRFDPNMEDYRRLADMPVPVDDAVAFAYAGRYIYLVSGWHDTGNVNLVQVYDAALNRWFRATDYPGPAVFGHSGGAVGQRFVIADGVAVIGETAGRRRFGAVDDVWLGEIDVADPAKIAWRALPPHPNGPLYRMAAMGDAERGRIVFAGGADNPYNYNGVGYDGAPARPSDRIFAYDLDAERWVDLGRRARATMDHRGLIRIDAAYATIGGLDETLDVVGDVVIGPIEK